MFISAHLPYLLSKKHIGLGLNLEITTAMTAIEYLSGFVRCSQSVASPAMGHWGTCSPPRSLCKL